jgi:hypothetical protein
MAQKIKIPRHALSKNSAMRDKYDHLLVPQPYFLYIQNRTTAKHTRHAKSQTGINTDLLFWLID